MTFGRVAFALGILCACTPGAFGGPIDGGMAREIIRSAMQARGLPAPAMAAPLRAFPACDHVPKVAPFNGDWAAAELTCTAPAPWRRVVRTGATPLPFSRDPEARNGAAGAQMFIVAARPLQKGARLGPGDLIEAPASGYFANSGLTAPQFALGRRLRVALSAGQPVQERHLDPALDVEPGQTVTVTLGGGGIEISTTARAVAGGQIGDRIALLPPSGGPALEGWIVAPGMVSVRPKLVAPDAVNK